MPLPVPVCSRPAGNGGMGRAGPRPRLLIPMEWGFAGWCHLRWYARWYATPERPCTIAFVSGRPALRSRESSAQVDRGSGERDCQDTRGRAGHDEPSLAEKNSRRERGGIQLRPEPEPGAHPGEAAVCAKRGIPRAGVVDDPAGTEWRPGRGYGSPRSEKGGRHPRAVRFLSPI